MKNNKKGFGLIGILIAIAIIAAIAGGAFYTTESTDTQTGEKESVIEIQLGAIDEAEKAKDLLENRDLGF